MPKPVFITSDPSQAPISLTDVEGDFLPSPHGDADTRDAIYLAFGVAPANYEAGDPRGLIVHPETQTLALWDGQLGIHTELELEIYKAAECLDDHGQPLPPSRERLSDRDFSRETQRLTYVLTDLQHRYPKTQFYLAHGEVTIDDRLSLCAFTPLIATPLSNTVPVNEEVFSYRSPYETTCALKDIDARLWDVAFPGTATKELDPIATCCHPDCGRFFDENAKRLACRAWAENACACDMPQFQAAG